MNYPTLPLVKKILLPCLLLSLVNFSIAFGQNNQGDSLALVALFNSTNGNSWTNNNNWLSNQPIDTWYGIGMTNGRVSSIFLANNNLDGPLPPEIANFKGLRTFFLANNQLSGAIPDEIGGLSDVVSLYFVNNNFSGSIPSSIKGLNRVSEIYFGNNDLSGNIPAEIGNLPYLSILNIKGNQLSGQIPPTIGDSPQLISLDLSFNQLAGTIPPELFRPAGLKQVFLNDNQIGGTIPSDIGNAVALTGVYLQNNLIAGGIPATIENLDELLVLDISHNDLNLALPAELGGLDKLKVLYLNDNDIYQPIPAALVDAGDLPQLTDFHLQNNAISGIIPSDIGNLSALQELRLDQNDLSGMLPKSLGALASLDYLAVDNNKLEGTVPPELADATALRYLSLNDNEFKDLPDLSDLTNLVGLYVQNNFLTFEDLEPNADISNSFNCSPQAPVNDSYSILTTAGSSEYMSVQIDGSTNVYQWTLNGVDIPNAIEPTFTVPSVSSSDEGIYECKVTNKDVDFLTIMRNPISLLIDVLPIELLSFKAKPNGMTVELDWITDNEFNNAFFSIERSNNGVDFGPIGSVAGNGTTQQRQAYSFVDEQPFYGISYYRLRQYDFDGRNSLSPVVVVEINKLFIDQVFPNPSVAGEQLTVGSNMEGKVLVSLADVNGKLVYQTELMGQGSFSSLQFTPTGLTPGIYFMSVVNEARRFTTKLTVIGD